MTQHRILLVNLSEGYGGVDARVIETARGLHGRREYAVAAIEGAPVHQRLAELGLAVETVPYGKRDPRNLLALFRIIRRGEYDVVDAHNDQSWLWGLCAAWIARVPVKISSVQLPCRITPGGVRGRVQEWILKLNLWCGCRFMTVNRFLIQYLKGIGVASEDISLIYNAIDLKKNAPINATADVRQIANWPENTFVFVTVARLVPQKAHDILLKALAEAVKEEPRIRCLLVGDGKLEEELKDQARELEIEPYVYFAGFRKDIPEILDGSDVFCLPSRSEGLPFALLEACGQKMPILISSADGMGELFTHQKTAYMVPAEDVSALTKGLIWHVNSMEEAKRIGRNAHEFVQNRLSPEVMVDQTLAFYAEQTYL